MITENLSTLKIHQLSQGQFEREQAAGNVDETAFYVTPDTSLSYEPQDLPEKQQAQARANIGAVSMKLLWKNSDPTSEYAAQKVALDLSVCYGVLVVPNHTSYGTLRNLPPVFVPIGECGEIQSISCAEISGALFGLIRRFVTSDTGVEFGDCEKHPDGDTMNANNIPMLIYGIMNVITPK